MSYCSTCQTGSSLTHLLRWPWMSGVVPRGALGFVVPRGRYLQLMRDTG